MESYEGKRRLSSCGEEAKHDFITKRLKSVEELGDSFKYIDSIESISRSTSVEMQSFSSTTSLELQSFSRCASIESSKSDMALDIQAFDDVEDEVIKGNESQPVSETVEMASQPDDHDMFDEGACYRGETGDHCSSRCKLLKQISRTILSVDEEPNAEPHLKADMCGVLAYVQDISPDAKTEIATYLSSGNLAHAQLTMENIHHFYHVSSLLHLKQLRDHCITFCRVNNQTKIISCFEGCNCENEVKMESATGYQRSQSVVSNPDDSDPPQYYIVFTDTVVSGKTDTQKIKVLVIDTSQKRNVYHRDVNKLQNFGEGFACTSFDVKGTPFIIVSGGVMKNEQLVMKYDIILGRWEKCAKLIHGRSHHMMVTTGSNSVFALGGREVSCIEEYCIKTNKWTERASLVTQVTSAVCQVYQNKIYIFGGTTPAGPVATAQCYDINTHEIKRLEDLPTAFEGGQSVVLNDRIYIATDQGHMIRFNPSKGYGRLCTQQPVKRKRFGMFVKQDRIYVVGGVLCDDDGETTTTTRIPQYRYNADKDVWIEKNKLNNSFSVLASCIINYEKKCCVIPFNEKF